MRIFLVLILLFSFASFVYAEIPEKKIKSFPEGTFKKARNGQIIQYDKNGKKVGVYKQYNGRFTKLK